MPVLSHGPEDTVALSISNSTYRSLCIAGSLPTTSESEIGRYFSTQGRPTPAAVVEDALEAMTSTTSGNFDGLGYSTITTVMFSKPHGDANIDRIGLECGSPYRQDQNVISEIFLPRSLVRTSALKISIP